jgi:ATP-dependent Clp protease ATP-binding subunit ClpA
MARVIQTEIKRVLADEILFGRLQNGGRVEVDEKDDRLVFSYFEARELAVAPETAESS